MKTLLPLVASLFLATTAQAGVYGGNPAPAARPPAHNTIVPVLKGVYGGNPTLHEVVAVSHPVPPHVR